MQDYFNMANLQQSGQGGNSGRLPIGVVNGVPYYTVADYQRALDAQRAQERQGRMDSITNFSNNMIQATEPLATGGANFGSNLNNAIYNQPSPSGPVTISGVGTVQNGQVYRNDQQRVVGMGNMNLPEQATVDPALISSTRRAGMDDPFATAQAIQNNANPSGFAAGSADWLKAQQSAVVDNDTIYTGAPNNRFAIGGDGKSQIEREQEQIALDRRVAQGSSLYNPVTISGAGTIQGNELFRSDYVDPEVARLQQFAGAGDAAITSTGVVDAELAATEARAEAEKAAIDAETTAARQAEFDAAQEAEDAAREAEGEAAATAAGTDLNQANQDAYQRNLASILESIDLRKKEAGESYSDLYQQFRDQQAFQSGITDTSGVRGGMARQDQSRESAAEIGALTDLASQRQRAVDTIEAEKLNAEVEAGRMTAEQFELQKTYNPMWQQGELLAQKYQETGDINDFNAYMSHMSGLLGLEPSLISVDNPAAAVAQVSQNAVDKINQYIQNPTLMQQLFGYGSSGIMAGLGAKIGIPALAKLGGVLLGAKGAAAAGTLVTAGTYGGVLVGGAAGTTAAATGAAGLAAKLGLGTAAAALGPALGVAIGGAFAVAGIIGLVNNIRRSKTGEAAEEAVENVFAEERKRIIGQGFTEAEADEAIELIRQTLPTAYRE